MKFAEGGDVVGDEYPRPGVMAEPIGMEPERFVPQLPGFIHMAHGGAMHGPGCTCMACGGGVGMAGGGLLSLTSPISLTRSSLMMNPDSEEENRKQRYIKDYAALIAGRQKNPTRLRRMENEMGMADGGSADDAMRAKIDALKSLDTGGVQPWSAGENFPMFVYRAGLPGGGEGFRGSYLHANDYEKAPTPYRRTYDEALQDAQNLLKLFRAKKLPHFKPGGLASSSKLKHPEKMQTVLHEFKHGQLHSGSSEGPLVTSRPQAIAIALSEARKTKMAEGGPVSKTGGLDNLIDYTNRGLRDAQDMRNEIGYRGYLRQFREAQDLARRRAMTQQAESMSPLSQWRAAVANRNAPQEPGYSFDPADVPMGLSGARGAAGLLLPGPMMGGLAALVHSGEARAPEMPGRTSANRRLWRYEIPEADWETHSRVSSGW